MKIQALLLCLPLLAVAGASSGSDPQPQPSISPVGDCMVAKHVTAWGVVDDRRLVVKSLGKRYYDIQLSNDCPDLNRRPYLTFRDGLRPLPLGSARGFRPGVGSDPVTNDGRICGDLGDAVIPVGGVHNGSERPCDISRMRRIDEATFERVFGMDSGTANEMLDAATATKAEVAAN